MELSHPLYFVSAAEMPPGMSGKFARFNTWLYCRRKDYGTKSRKKNPRAQSQRYFSRVKSQY
jgi:hypothetical protein